MDEVEELMEANEDADVEVEGAVAETVEEPEDEDGEGGSDLEVGGRRKEDQRTGYQNRSEHKQGNIASGKGRFFLAPFLTGPQQQKPFILLFPSLKPHRCIDQSPNISDIVE